MRKNRRIKLTAVRRGTYVAIANEVGCSAEHVRHVAMGIARNYKIERLLMQAVEENIKHQRLLSRCEKLLQKHKLEKR